MIIVKFIGGLGNQLFQQAIGRTISIKCDGHLKLDISAFARYELHAYSLQHFNIVEQIASPAEIAIFDSSSDWRMTRVVLRHVSSALPEPLTVKREVDAASKDVSQAIMGVPSVCIHIRSFTFRFREKRDIVRLAARLNLRVGVLAPRLAWRKT
jgi:hypothetical protein